MIKDWIIKILAGLSIVLSILLWFYYSENEHNKRQANSFKSLYNQSKETPELFKDKEGNEHLKETPAIVETKAALKDDPEFQRLVKIVEGLNARNVQTISTTGINTEYHITTKIKDSTVHDTIKHECINFDSKFMSVHGCEGNYKYQSKDSISEVVYWERKKIIGLRIGKKQYEREVINFNPDSHFSYSKSVTFQKK